MKLFQRTYKMMFDHWRVPNEFTPVIKNSDGTRDYLIDNNMHSVIKDEYFKLLEFIRNYCVGTNIKYENVSYTIKEINSYAGIIVFTLTCKNPSGTMRIDLEDLYT